MNISTRLRSLALLVPLTAPMVVALAGCGGDETKLNPKTDAVIKSESSYNDAIAKEKAAGKPTGATK